jgi:hypothetical protein
MVLVGAIVAVLALSAASLRGPRGSAALTRLAFRVLLLAALPAFVVMRVGAEWVASEAQWASRPGSDRLRHVGRRLLLIVIATVLAWRGTRRATRSGRLGTAVVGLSALLLLALTVTIWAMTTKPA